MADLRGITNCEADALSRGKEVQGWCLESSKARGLFKTWDWPTWSLFADSSKTLAPCYFILDKRDWRAGGTDAFLRDRKTLKGPLYAFPLPQLLSQALAKVVKDKVLTMLIAACWEDAAWLPKLLPLSQGTPKRLPTKTIT